jgi:hypothetical protein
MIVHSYRYLEFSFQFTDLQLSATGQTALGSAWLEVSGLYVCEWDLWGDDGWDVYSLGRLWSQIRVCLFYSSACSCVVADCVVHGASSWVFKPFRRTYNWTLLSTRIVTIFRWRLCSEISNFQVCEAPLNHLTFWSNSYFGFFFFFVRNDMILVVFVVSHILGTFEGQSKYQLLDIIRLDLMTSEEVLAAVPSLHPLYIRIEEKYSDLCTTIQVCFLHTFTIVLIYSSHFFLHWSI